MSSIAAATYQSPHGNFTSVFERIKSDLEQSPQENPVGFCMLRPAARGVQRESRKRGEGERRARRSRARASLPPVSNRGVQIANGQPFSKAKS